MMDLRYVAGGISVTTSNGNESAFNRDEATIIIGDFLPTPVTHPDTNRAWRRVTTLIETTALPLSQIGNQWIIHVSYFTSCFNKRCFNPLASKGNYSAPPNSLLAVSNVTAHPSTASVPITVLLYDGPLFCGFNVATKGLTASSATSEAWFIRMYSRWQKNNRFSDKIFEILLLLMSTFRQHELHDCGARHSQSRSAPTWRIWRILLWKFHHNHRRKLLQGC